jgi:hypothetical protein
MTRDQAQASTPAEDPYAAHRCLCGHLVYSDDMPGQPCRWGGIEGRRECRGGPCLNHRPSEVPDAASS